MKRVFSQPLLKHCEQNDREKGETRSLKNGVAAFNQETECQHHHLTDQFHSMTLQKREPITKLDERPTWKKHGLWRQEQKMRAARLEKQLKALEDRINKQLNHFRTQYTRPIFPTRLEDVAQLLMPKSTPPLELATLSWLGDWRPSAIVGLLRSLARSSSSLASDTAGIERALSQLIHDIRIEEAVIDEEIMEIQANCILHLPFSPVEARPSQPALACVQSEFKKVHRVIVKAHNLRIKALEMVVKKVLGQTDAAEFLVAFAGIQDVVHQLSTEYKLRKGPVSIPLESGLEQAEFEIRSSKMER